MIIGDKAARVPCPELAGSRDFWRGMVDGDGSIGLCDDGRFSYARITLCGQKRIVEAFAEFLLARVGAHLNATRTASGIWRVQTRVSGTAYDAVDVLYRDATVALDRKLIVAQRILHEAWRPPRRGR